MPAPTQSQETVLYRFAGHSDGDHPTADLTDVNGVLYGTTPGGGGSNSYGTVFKITTAGEESVIYRFRSGRDGAVPEAGLTNVGGVLYGTTTAGGDANGDGTIFEITTSGAESVLHRFAGGSDGSHPEAVLTDVNGVLYGTTLYGGDANNEGTVFEITTSGAESVLYRFQGLGKGDGANPAAGLVNVNGVLYGTTEGGGIDDGTVFKITTSGAESVLHQFGIGNDGYYPVAALANVNGVCYGTTEQGGAPTKNGVRHGTVFKITTSGTETVLHSFVDGNDGEDPYGRLININGVLYGTASGGGENATNLGTVFKITTAGELSELYTFLGGRDGAVPLAGLTNVNGVLYGTTYDGGANSEGTVFSLSL
jgi:uncharacterized repeat protein (TIGR03803 family)